MPGNRRGMLRRHSQSKVMAIAEHGIALLWAVAIVASFFESKASMVPILLVGLILWTFRPKPEAAPRAA
jgi:ABC-2 type transport system permease protein